MILGRLKRMMGSPSTRVVIPIDRLYLTCCGLVSLCLSGGSTSLESHLKLVITAVEGNSEMSMRYEIDLQVNISLCYIPYPRICHRIPSTTETETNRTPSQAQLPPLVHLGPEHVRTHPGSINLTKSSKPEPADQSKAFRSSMSMSKK